MNRRGGEGADLKYCNTVPGNEMKEKDVRGEKRSGKGIMKEEEKEKKDENRKNETREKNYQEEKKVRA